MKNQQIEGAQKLTLLSEVNFFVFWFLALIAMIAATVIPKTLGLGMSVSTTALIAVMVLYMILRTDYVRTKRFDEYEENFRHTLTLSVFSLFIFFYLEQVASRNPWGAIGWIITFTVYALVVILLLLKKNLKELTIYNWGLYIIAPLVVIGCVAEIYLHWAMWWVWVPIGTIIFFACTSIQPKLDEFSREDLIFVFVVLGIGVISTVWQFWTLETFWGLKLWELLGWVAIVIALIFLILFVLSKLNEHIQGKEWEKSQEKQENEAKEKAREVLNTVRQMKDEIENSLFAKSKDILEFLKLTNRNNLSNHVYLEHKTLAKLMIRDLIEVSEVKNQIHFENDDIRIAFHYFNRIARDCYNDIVLSGLKEQFIKLEKLKNYEGYPALMREKDNNNFHYLVKLLQS